jgi:hypothetical protein
LARPLPDGGRRTDRQLGCWRLARHRQPRLRGRRPVRNLAAAGCLSTNSRISSYSSVCVSAGEEAMASNLSVSVSSERRTKIPEPIKLSARDR